MSEQVNLQEALVKKAAFGNDIDLENLMIITNSMCKVPPSFQQQGKNGWSMLVSIWSGRIAAPALFRSTMRLLRPK